MLHLYFASCVPEGGIFHYTLRDGDPFFEEKTSCPEPMFLSAVPGSLQALLRAPFPEGENSALIDYPLNSDGRLGTPGPLMDTQGIVACHLCRWHGQTYGVNYVSGSVFCSSGALDTHCGRGKDPERQEAPHTHFIAPAPDGACLLSTDLGLDTVYSYDRDLNILATAPVPAGHGARHLAYSEDGSVVFCVNEMATTVTAFHYAHGSLSPIETVAALFHPVPGSTAAAIRVHGNYVYVSNRGDDSISCLLWDGNHLSLQSVTPCGGRSPRDFLFVEDLIFCTNELSDNVTVFRAEGAKLCNTGISLSMPHPLCAVALSLPEAAK